MKRWQRVPARGVAVDDPVVRTLATTPHPGTRPVVHRIDGRMIVTYTRTRLHLDRAAWESLPSDGILLLRIRPRSAQPFALALTRVELEQTFGEVRDTDSWDEVRCYHFPKLPPAAEAFRVTAL